MAGERPSTRAVVLTVAVFILGVIVGALGCYLAGHMRESRRVRFIDRITQTLQLSTAQQKQIVGILQDGHRRIAAIYRQSQDQARPQYDAVRSDDRAKIRAILTPDQQTKFDDFLKRLDAERKARQQQTPSH